jgi:coenzyme F420-0:L-glutamate ligase / coenzyme F420-1:gamma-L-glutamate ligase
VSEALEIRPLRTLPEVAAGESVGRLVASAAGREGVDVGSNRVVVVSHKVVSKAEGRLRDLADIEPGERARELAERLDKDPRLVELILGESRAVIRAERGVLITETHHGWICANAGIDSSNVPGDEVVALLPEDPDGSARRVRAEVREATGGAPGVVIGDSFGRPWRVGQADVAIGCAGIRPLADWRGRRDREGRELTATLVAVADEIAAAADLAREKDAGLPVVVIAGLAQYVTADDGPGAAPLRRTEADDLFR